MGCGASTSTKYLATDNTPLDARPDQAERSPTKTRDDADSGFASAYEDASPLLEMQYPLYCMKMSDFLALDTLLPHNGLRERGLVVPLDLEGEHAGAHVQFVSHQWLGFTVADPNGDHLRTMQAAFQVAMTAPEKLFKNDEDWQAYARGYTEANAATLLSSKTARAIGEGRTLTKNALPSVGADASTDDAREFFAACVRDGWVWMDFISVPQTIGLASAALVKEALQKQALAIRSIPAYIRKVNTFWICTPSGAKHENGSVCSYASWYERGWCRLEENTISLLHLANARPMLLTEPVGQPPLVTVPDFIDRQSVHIQRRSSVLTGAFSCCRLQHKVESLDGTITEIPCDKVILREVLKSVFEEGLAKAQASRALSPS